MAKDDSKFITVKMPNDLVDRLHEEEQRLKTATPGVDITFSDAVRVAINRGLTSCDK